MSTKIVRLPEPASWMTPSERTWRARCVLEIRCWSRCVHFHPAASACLVSPKPLPIIQKTLGKRWYVSICSKGRRKLRSNPEPSAEQRGQEDWRTCPHHSGRPGHRSVSFICHLPLHTRPNGELPEVTYVVLTLNNLTIALEKCNTFDVACARRLSSLQTCALVLPLSTSL